MKHYKEIEEIEKVKKLIKTTCDICGKDFKPEIPKDDGTIYDQVVLSHRKGFEYESYGDYYDGSSTLELDICGDCFKDKIKPFLKSIGANIQYRDYSEDVTDDPDEEESKKSP